MKKVIITIDDAGNMLDDTGLTILNISGMTYKFTEVGGGETDIDVVKLVGLGVSPDDLIKMKASGVI